MRIVERPALNSIVSISNLLVSSIWFGAGECQRSVSNRKFVIRSKKNEQWAFNKNNATQDKGLLTYLDKKGS